VGPLQSQETCSVSLHTCTAVNSISVHCVFLRLSIFLYSCCSHSEYRTSVKRFVSIQFLNPKTVVKTPWTGDQPAARPLPTQIQNKHEYPYLEWDSNSRSLRSSGRRHCLRPCPAWQRRASTCGRALLPHADKHRPLRLALTEFKHIKKHVFSNYSL
jgi:hypothetical protein